MVPINTQQSFPIVSFSHPDEWWETILCIHEDSKNGKFVFGWRKWKMFFFWKNLIFAWLDYKNFAIWNISFIHEFWFNSFFLFSHSFIHSIIFSIFLSFPEYKFQFLFLFFCIFIISIWIWFELFHPSFLHIMPSYTSRSLLSLPHALLFLLFYIITPNHYYIYWKCFFYYYYIAAILTQQPRRQNPGWGHRPTSILNHRLKNDVYILFTQIHGK